MAKEKHSENGTWKKEFRQNTKKKVNFSKNQSTGADFRTSGGAQQLRGQSPLPPPYFVSTNV